MIAATKDTDIAILHVPYKVGGLYIPRLFLIIPVLRFGRINLIKLNNDSLIVFLENIIIMKWNR